MIKLIFNAHYLNFDDMVCSDKSFFKLNTKKGNSLRFPLALPPMMYIASLLMMMDDFHLPFIT